MSKIGSIMGRHGIKDGNLAAACAVSRQAVASWRSGATEPSRTKAPKALRYLRLYDPALALDDIAGQEPEEVA
jgi:DNA-binding transcriptional regulator YiaG